MPNTAGVLVSNISLDGGLIDFTTPANCTSMAIQGVGGAISIQTYEDHDNQTGVVFDIVAGGILSIDGPLSQKTFYVYGPVAGCTVQILYQVTL